MVRGKVDGGLTPPLLPVSERLVRVPGVVLEDEMPPQIGKPAPQMTTNVSPLELGGGGALASSQQSRRSGL